MSPSPRELRVLRLVVGGGPMGVVVPVSNLVGEELPDWSKYEAVLRGDDVPDFSGEEEYLSVIILVNFGVVPSSKGLEAYNGSLNGELPSRGFTTSVSSSTSTPMKLALVARGILSCNVWNSLWNLAAVSSAACAAIDSISSARVCLFVQTCWYGIACLERRGGWEMGTVMEVNSEVEWAMLGRLFFSRGVWERRSGREMEDVLTRFGGGSIGVLLLMEEAREPR